MARYLIDGIQRSTGRPVRGRLVEAPDEAGACLLADEVNIAVRRIRPERMISTLGPWLFIVGGVLFMLASLLMMLRPGADDEQRQPISAARQPSPVIGPENQIRLTSDVVAQRDVLMGIDRMRESLPEKGVAYAKRWHWQKTGEASGGAWRALPGAGRPERQWYAIEVHGDPIVRMIVLRAVADVELDTELRLAEKVEALREQTMTLTGVNGIDVVIREQLEALKAGERPSVRSIERLDVEIRVGIEDDPLGFAIAVAVLRPVSDQASDVP